MTSVFAPVVVAIVDKLNLICIFLPTVWDLESGLNIHKQDECTDNIKTNSGSYVSDNSESLTIASLTSSEGPLPTAYKSGDEADNGMR